MLREAFNALTGIHSRPAQIRRPGNPDIYSPCRLTPSNYFRFLQGPESIVFHGREFVIPVDSMSGQFARKISFLDVPDAGAFTLQYGPNVLDSTTGLDYQSTAAQVQTALRLITGLEDVLVTGNFTIGFSVVFSGFSTTPLALIVSANTLTNTSDPVTTNVSSFGSPLIPLLKRGDKIVDTEYGLLTIDECIEMVDVGTAIIGYRVRAE